MENHLNMVRPMVEKPAVSLRVIAAFLNSEVVDAAFRCISGSVAVSATELEALPLPSPAQRGAWKASGGRQFQGDPSEPIRAGLYMREQTHVAA